MTKDEALKLALKALDIYDYTGTAEESELVSKAINACKEAIATNKESSLVQPAQEQDIIKLAELAGFILKDDQTRVDWSSDYDDCLFKFAMLVKATNKDYVLLCKQCAKELNILE